MGRAHVRDAAARGRADAVIAVLGPGLQGKHPFDQELPSLATLAALAGRRFVVHDPLVRSGQHRQAGDPLEALDEADALMILTPWDVYRRVSPVDISRRLRGRLVLDPYRVLDRQSALASKLDYRTLGVAGPFEQADARC